MGDISSMHVQFGNFLFIRIEVIIQKQIHKQYINFLVNRFPLVTCNRDMRHLKTYFMNRLIHTGISSDN